MSNYNFTNIPILRYMKKSDNLLYISISSSLKKNELVFKLIIMA